MTESEKKMTEEIKSEEFIVTQAPDTMSSQYKSVCMRIGFFVTVCFLMRSILPFAIAPLYEFLFSRLDTFALYGLQLIISALICQIIPAVIVVFLLRYGLDEIRESYRRPKTHIKAVSNFPALYGFGMTVNLLTITVIQLLTKQGDINESFNPISEVQPPTLSAALLLFFLIAVIAPVSEEFIFRGAVLNALKPFGNGLAVFVSAFLFGLFHGNFSQFFYAFALGIGFGYIAIVTKSIYTTTVLHALFNSIGAIFIIFSTTNAVNGYLGGNMSETPDGEAFVLTLFAIFCIAVLLTAFIGFILFIKKLVHIKRYRLPPVWTEISNGRKLVRLIVSVPMLFALLLVVDAFGGNFISVALINLIKGAVNG